jgi:hypothetical protein
VQWRNLDVPGMERLQQPRHSASSFAPAISMMKTAKPGADGRPGAELVADDFPAHQVLAIEKRYPFPPERDCVLGLLGINGKHVEGSYSGGKEFPRRRH